MSSLLKANQIITQPAQLTRQRLLRCKISGLHSLKLYRGQCVLYYRKYDCWIIPNHRCRNFLSDKLMVLVKIPLTEILSQLFRYRVSWTLCLLTWLWPYVLRSIRCPPQSSFLYYTHTTIRRHLPYLLLVPPFFSNCSSFRPLLLLQHHRLLHPPLHPPRHRPPHLLRGKHNTLCCLIFLDKKIL